MYFHCSYEWGGDECFTAALAKAVEIAIDNGDGEIGLAVHSLSNLQGVIRNVFGQDVVDNLGRGHHEATLNVNEFDQLDLRVITERIPQPSFEGPIIAAFTSFALATRLAALEGCTSLIFVPHSEEEQQLFVENFETELIPRATPNRD